MENDLTIYLLHGKFEVDKSFAEREMMYKLRVVQIVSPTAVDEYPEYVADTTEFPHLVPYVEEDTRIFVVNPTNPQQFWPANEFFYMVPVKSLLVEPKE